MSHWYKNINRIIINQTPDPIDPHQEISPASESIVIAEVRSLFGYLESRNLLDLSHDILFARLDEGVEAILQLPYLRAEIERLEEEVNSVVTAKDGII